jgi:hypothetical protein
MSKFHKSVDCHGINYTSQLAGWNKLLQVPVEFCGKDLHIVDRITVDS